MGGTRNDKESLEAAIDRLQRLAKELKGADLAGIKDRWDDRIEAFQKRINTTLSDVLGHGSADFKDLKVGPLAASLEGGFDDRYSSSELSAAIRQGLDAAIANVNIARKSLEKRLDGAPAKGAAPAPAVTPEPTAAPTPEPTPAATAAPTPKASPTPAPTPAPTAAPTPAPTRTPAPTPAPTNAPAPRASAPAPTPSSPSRTSMSTAQPASGTARRVAVISNLGDDAAGNVAAFLSQLGLEPVVVGDAPVSDDVTFIDRLEGARGADYAIVLTPAAGLAAEPGTHAGPRTETLLEVGFLFGVLGRKKVCFLVEGKPSISSELQGMVQVQQLDDGELWKLLLAREMRKSGIDVDMNKAV